MKHLPLVVVLGILIAALGALFNSYILGPVCENMPFKNFANADRVEITDNQSKPLRKINNPTEVRQLVEFVLAHKSGWRAPFPDTPIARINAQFYHGEAFLGDFGVGSDFLTAQGCGYFQSRGVSPNDRATVMKLFAVKDLYENDP